MYEYFEDHYSFLSETIIYDYNELNKQSIKRYDFGIVIASGASVKTN